ncbi:MAG: hypothetical protein J6C98_00985 [Oscillospiraceae bacterium]|nr:hypothetical protein [Oscillospiraceae bacterium]
MFNKKRYLYLNDEDFSILVQALVQFRNSLIAQSRYTDCVDELIIKILDSPIKKMGA